MKVVIITSMPRGVASLAIGPLVRAPQHTLLGVVRAQTAASGKPALKRKLRKMLRIGFAGAVNGVRIRPWFSQEPLDLAGAQPVDEVAAAAGVPVWQVPVVNSDETIERLRSAQADLAISLGNSYIAERIFSIPRLGTINIHHELLPRYKGAQSIIWQLYDGSRDTGYTIHRMDRTIDGGDILYQETVPMHFGDTLHDTVVKSCAKLYVQSVRGLVEVLDRFEELAAAARSQRSGHSYTTPSIWQFLRMQRQHAKLKSASR